MCSTILFLLLLYGVKSERDVSENVSAPPAAKVLPNQQENRTCVNGDCNCDYGYYSKNVSNSSLCIQCPGQGEDCSVSDCCYSTSMYLACVSGVCQCMENYNGYICWSTADTAQRYRFQKIAQFILAIGLIFTSVIIVILFWKACSRGVHTSIPHVDSYVSLNSIQRLVLLRLQDRPPTYSQIYQPMKRHVPSRRAQILPPVPAYEEPPPYSETPTSNQAYENRIFFINEHTSSENIETNSTDVIPHVTTQTISPEQKPELHI